MKGSFEKRPKRRSNLAQSLLGVAEAVETHACLFHEGEVQAAHLSVGTVEVIEETPRANLAAAFAEENDQQLIVVVSAHHHTRAVQDHRDVEQRALPFLNAVEATGDVRGCLKR